MPTSSFELSAELLKLTHAMWGVWLSFSPFLLLGALLAGLLHVTLPEGFVGRYLSGRSGVWRAVLFGVPLPLCSCGVIPAGLGLKRDGASAGATMGFLISTPQTGVDSILVSGVALGWPFALSKVFAAVVTGLFGGWIADLVEDREPTQEFTDKACTLEMSDPQEPSPPAPPSKLKALFAHALEVVEPIWGWVLVGVIASALIELYLPTSSLEAASAYGGLVAMFISLTLSLPLYVCATSSVPIAAALVAKGLPVGAALVFLMAGPATNIATMGAIYRGLGRRQLAVYLSVLITGAVLFGLLFERLLGELSPVMTHHHHDEAAWWAVLSAVLMAVLFVSFMVSGLRQAMKARRASSAASLTFSVEGVTCGGCVRKIERLFSEREDVREVTVRRNPDEVTLEGQISEAEARALLEGAGHPVSTVLSAPSIS